MPQLVVAALTPLAEDLHCRVEVLAAHCRRLLAASADGIALFGTTGFGPALPTRERMEVLDGLVASGVPADKLIIGVSAASFTDMVVLTRHGTAQGCRGCFVMPPFFFRTEDGTALENTFARLIDDTADDRLRLYLYNLPSFHGAPVPVATLGNLDRRYPGCIAGIKDSSGDWAYLRTLLETYPSHQVFTGIETMLPGAVDLGGAGAISGLANLVPGLVAQLVGADTPARAAALQAVTELVDVIPDDAVIAALAALMAEHSGEDIWRHVPPPLEVLASERLGVLAKVYDQYREWTAVAA